MTSLVLASTSKHRRLLLERLHLPFIVAPSNVDETPLPNETPTALVLRLAEEKARAVASQFPDALIIGADQVGVLNDQILCKPLTHANAVAQLQRMSGQRIRFLIGLCVLNTRSNMVQVELEKFDISLRQLSLGMIENYLQKEDALQCAGSIRADGLGIALVAAFHDTDFSALIGLPLIRLISMLEKEGLTIV